MAAEGGLVSRANDMFHITVNNTVTRYFSLIRYPFCQDTFTTTVSETYKGRPTARVPPIKPKGTHVNDNIHPSSKMVETINGTEFKHIRELSTVTRRTYVAPEVMKESE
jgi:hypothetical protein